jgi:hypothetical protein
VNKKKQKNFLTWDSACGDVSATRKLQRNKSFLTGTVHVATTAPHALSRGVKVFCFFFFKKEALASFP